MKEIKKTCLIVGEGQSEVAFLKHLRKMEECRRSNLRITIKNAFGKGARHVIEYTIRTSSHIDYDIIIAFFDTDTDWDAQVEKKAKDHNIITNCSKKLIFSE